MAWNKVLRHSGYIRAISHVRSAREVGKEAREAFLNQRWSPEYRKAYFKPQPLISVLIATYNRAELLTERTIPSVIAQTYRNFELIIVGDCCTDDTAERVAAINDPRIIFVNLPQRGDYPTDPKLRWMVAGTAPVNHALSLAKGDFITHLDDDDEFHPQRLEALLHSIKYNSADLVFHSFHHECADGSWLQIEAKDFSFSKVSTGTIFYHHWFKRIPWDPLAYRLREPGDWNRLRKIKYIGAVTKAHPGFLLDHYRERARADTAH